MSRLTMLIAVLGVMALCGCSSNHSLDSIAPAARTSGVTNPDPQEQPTAPTAPVPKPAVAGTNRTLAVAAAARAIERFPVPPGATRVKAAPLGTPRLHLGAYDDPVDPTLTRTRWWVVPLRYDRLVAWYTAHTRADIHSTLVLGATKPAPHGVLEWQTADSSSAYSTPAQVVDYARLGPQTTALRTDVTLAARADRTVTTLVPGTVTSIDLIKRAIDGPDTSPRAATVTDQGQVLAAVAAFDQLRGDYAHTLPHACGSPVGLVYVYGVTFHWPGHTLVVDPGAELCGTGRGLMLDGTNLPQTLENDVRLDHALKVAFGDA